MDSADGRVSLTQLLSEHSPNDREILDQVIPLVYDELRRLARRQLAGNRNLTLNTTALVDEAYLEMVDQEQAPLGSRAIFFGAASRAMRQVLVDAARRRQALKRGGDQFRVTLNESSGIVPTVLAMSTGSISPNRFALHARQCRAASPHPRRGRQGDYILLSSSTERPRKTHHPDSGRKRRR